MRGALDVASRPPEDSNVREGKEGRGAGLAGYLSIDALRGVYTSIPQRCAERVIHPDYGTLPSKLLYVLVKSAGKGYSDMEQRFKAECGS